MIKRKPASGKFRNRFRTQRKKLKKCSPRWNCKEECGWKRFTCRLYWKRRFPEKGIVYDPIPRYPPYYAGRPF